MDKNFSKNIILFFLLFLCSSLSYSASFDCMKANAEYEKKVCSDNVLNHLDEALSNNYNIIMNSELEQVVKDRVKKEQREWLNKRNSCDEYSCLISLYRSRVNNICEKYGFFTGKSSCISTQDISTQINKENDLAKKEDEKNRIPVGEVLQHLVDKHSDEVSKLGFSKSQLASSIYFSLSSSYVRYGTLQEYLSLMFDVPNLKSISKIDNGNFFGFKIKVAGSPSTGFTFKVEDDELYLNGLVIGDDVVEVVTAGQANQISNTFYVYAVQVLYRNNAKL